MWVVINIIKYIKTPILLLVFTLFFGSIGYKIIYPDIEWSKIFFMVAITLSTVGYEDVLEVEKSPLAMYYTMLLILVGMGTVLYAISALTAFIVEGNLKKLFTLEAIKRKIKSMKDHYIICGGGETGIHVIHEMYYTKRNFVVIDHNEEILERLRLEYKDCLTIHGDATSDETLDKANIHQAKGFLAILPSDKDNLFLTISARLMNSSLKIASKGVETHMYKKLKNAGADYIVSPPLIGGLRLASEIIRPHVVNFLDCMLKDQDKSIRIEEVTITKQSGLIEKSIGSSQIYDKTGLVILAIKKESNWIYNPSLNTKIQAGMVLLAICNTKQREKLIKLVNE